MVMVLPLAWLFKATFFGWFLFLGTSKLGQVTAVDQLNGRNICSRARGCKELVEGVNIVARANAKKT